MKSSENIMFFHDFCLPARRVPTMKVYVSGVHSGPNPSPGVGTARSLREAYPDVELVSVDYSNESSGIHHSVFDDVLLFRPWNELDLNTYTTQISELLSDDAWWLSGLDLEVEWLANHFPQNRSVLTPPADAYKRTRKPTIPAASNLPVQVPTGIKAFGPDTEIEQFCQQHDWQVWVKGPDYDALPVSTWRELVQARRILAQVWNTKDIVVQPHQEGKEVAIPFAASDGQLLEAVLMEKRVWTESGKTWAGSVSPLPENVRDALANTIADLNWTGGGELEFVQESNGQLHLIDWNPRLPAWVYGATLTGTNLPALLLAELTDKIPGEKGPQGHEFTRIVEEHPVRESHPLPQPASEDHASLKPDSKHPSGMPQLARRSSPDSDLHGGLTEVDEHIHADLDDIDLASLETPERVWMERATQKGFSTAQAALQDITPPAVSVQLAYSVKTNPHPKLLELAKQQQLFAEVITGEELAWAQQLGFAPDEIVVNGPVGVHDLLEAAIQPVAGVFADSLPAFEKLIRDSQTPAKTLGLRVRPPNEPSRFGIPLSEQEIFNEVVMLLDELPNDTALGLHLHIQSSRVGTKKWDKLARSLIAWGEAIEGCTDQVIRTLDFGGGWAPDSFQEVLPKQLRSILPTAKDRLSGLETVLLEPGKALARPSATLLSRVIEVRDRTDGFQEIIVDASRSELPLANNRSYSVLVYRDGTWQRVGPGDDRLLGRICMENDVLTTGLNVPSLDHGDVVAFPDVGAYDTSMAYNFGNGGQ